VATYHAVAAIGAAMVRLLTDAAQVEPDFAGGNFKLAHPSDFQGTLPGLGVLIFLYRVTPNMTRRNLPPRLLPNGRRTRPPLPVDLHFLLSPWATTADTQLRLLGWMMRTLDDTPVLPVGLLNSDEGSPELETFHSDETVELVFETLTVQDQANLWEIVKPRTQAGATYVARQVAIESSEPIVEAGPVQTRDFGYGKPIEQVLLGARP